MTETGAGFSIDPHLDHVVGPSFRLVVPEGERGWRDRSIYCIAGPVHEGLQATLTMTVEHHPDGENPEEIAGAALRELKGQLDEFELLERTHQSIAGRAAPKAVFSWRTPEGAHVRQSQWYVYIEPLLMVLTTSAHDDLGEQAEELFAPLLAALKITDRRV